MIFKLKTSKKTMEYFLEMNGSIHLQPFALSKLALALAIREEVKDEMLDFNTDNDGLELNRQTITGDYDKLFQVLIKQCVGHKITEEEYFPKYMKAFLDYGASLLYAEFKYSNNEFYDHLLKLDDSI